MFKACPPRWQDRAHRPVALLHPVQHGRALVGQQEHGRQQGRERVPTVAGVVLEVIACGFQDVMVCSLDLPAAAPGGHERHDGGIGHRVGGHPRVGV